MRSILSGLLVHLSERGWRGFWTTANSRGRCGCRTPSAAFTRPDASDQDCWRPVTAGRRSGTDNDSVCCPSRWHPITPLLFCLSPGSDVLLAPVEGRRPSASLWDGLDWRGACLLFFKTLFTAYKGSLTCFKRASVLSWRWLVLDQTFTQLSWRPCSPRASSYRRRASWSGFR